MVMKSLFEVEGANNAGRDSSMVITAIVFVCANKTQQPSAGCRSLEREDAAAGKEADEGECYGQRGRVIGREGEIKGWVRDGRGLLYTSI